MEDDWASAEIPDGVLVGYVWSCGDTCGCSDARIIRRVWKGSYWDTWTLWQGPIHLAGWEEPGEVSATTELNREARRLRRHHHDLYRRIEWPWTKTAAQRSA